MATITNNVRWADNTEELKKNLLSGIGTLDAMKSSVDRTVASLSGNGLMAAANKTAAAILEMGGASKLTTSEMERVNTQLEKAIEKYKVMGMTAPPQMVALAEATKQHPPLLERITSALGPVGTAAAGAFTATAIIGAAKHVLDFADNITNMAQRLGMSTSGVQKLQLAFQPFGVDIDTVGKAAAKLAELVVGGDKSAVAALGKLGLSATTLKGMSIDEMFITVGDAVGKVGNQAEKLYAGKTLFGKGGVDLLAGLDGHLRETTDQFESMGLIIDEKTIKAADDFGDQLGLMGKQLLGIVATIIGPLLPAISAIGSILMWVGNNVIGPVFNFAVKGAMTLLGLFWEGLSALLSKIVGFGSSLPFVGDKFAAMSKTLADSSASTTKYLDGLWKSTAQVGEKVDVVKPKMLGLGAANDEAAAKAKKYAAAWEEINAAGATWQETYANIPTQVRGLAADYLTAGHSVDTVATALGLEKIQVEAVSKSLDDHKKALEILEGIQKLFTSEGNKHWNEWKDAVAKQLKAVNDLAVANFTDRLAAQKAFDDEVAKRTMDAYAYQKFKIAEHLADQKAALIAKGGDWKAAFDLDTKVANDAIEAIEWQKIQDDIDATDQATADWEAHNKANLDSIINTFTQLAQISGGTFGQIAQDIGTVIATMRLGKESGTQFKNALASIKPGGGVGGYVQLAGSIGGAVSALDAATSSGSTAERALKGAASGAAIGTAIFPGFGTAIGAGVGALVGWIRGAKAAHEEMVHLRDVEHDFEKQLWATMTATQAMEAGNQGWAATTIVVRDAYLATGRSAAEAEHDVAAMWAATEQGAEASKAAIDKVNQAFTEQKQDAADLDAAIQKYGFSIEELGPTMQRQKLTEQAVELMNDFRLLAGSGIDVDVVLGKMGGSINDFVAAALRTGTEVPSQMKPMLDKMIEMGTLTDENGNKITDLGDSGLTFSETMTQGFDRIVKKFDELLTKIGMVPAVIARIPTEINTDVNVHVRRTTEDVGSDVGGAAMGGLVTNHGVQYLAAGGNVLSFAARGTDTVPAMLTPGEGIVSRRGMGVLGADGLRALNRGGGGGTVVDFSALHAEVKQLRADMARRDASMIEASARATRDAVQKIGRRR